jgi:hypothetical protein
MHPRTQRKIGLAALLLLAVLMWIVCIFLLIQVTTTLLDTLKMIIELAQMG